VAAAACIAGADPDRIRQLPDTTGLRDEIVIQRCQRIQYDQALRAAGARLVEAGDERGATAAEIEAAIGSRTAALIFIESPRLGQRGVDAARMAAIAHGRALPLIVDAASTLPPAGHLTRWTDQGADLVIYSGGKGIRGPQGTGLLVGRADLVRAAAANAAPNAAIGRPAKVGKEDLVALVAAVELFLDTDHDAEWARHRAEAAQIADAVVGLPGIRVTIEEDRAVWSAPSVLIGFDPVRTGLTPHAVMAALRAGEPPIMVRVFEGELLVDPHCLQPGEAEVVARRLRAIVGSDDGLGS
jgi:L-seryl-tRNA(Ser) seleniumtransferase